MLAKRALTITCKLLDGDVRNEKNPEIRIAVKMLALVKRGG